MISKNRMENDQYQTFCRGGLDDPYPFYQRLRAEDPVHWSDTLNGWVLTSYEHVFFGLRDRRLSARRIHLWMDALPEPMRTEKRALGDRLEAMLIHLDPPDHTRLRKLVSQAFTPRVVESLRPRIHATVDGLLDQAERKGEMELIADFAWPLPATVISDMIGIPPADRDRFRKWAQEIVAFNGATSLTIVDVAEQAYRSMLELSEYFTGLIDLYRRKPEDNLLSTLVKVEEQGDLLSEEELVSMCNLLFVAGHETTMNLIGNGILALLKHPEQLALLREEPAIINSCIEECLRYESPVKRQSRLALEDVEIGGKLVRKGQYVMNMLGAANRDPVKFSDPDRFDILRKENDHLAFGSGIHFCLGAFLARVEGQIAIETVIRRFPAIRLQDEKPRWRENMAMRSLVALPVTFA